MNNELTKREADTLKAIDRIKGRTGLSPTLSELAKELKLKGTFSVRRHIQNLTEKGHLKPRKKGRARTIVRTQPKS